MAEDDDLPDEGDDLDTDAGDGTDTETTTTNDDQAQVDTDKGDEQGQDGGEGEVEDGAKGAGDQDQGQQTRGSRGERRISRLANENRELRDRLARVEGSQTAMGNIAAQEQRRRQEEDERRRLLDMTPEERLDHQRRRDREEIDARIARGNFEVTDRIDQSDFDRLCEKYPQYDGIREEVENRIQGLRRNGSNVSRQIMARQIIGERAERNGARAAGKARRQGEANIRRETSRPASARSDGGGSRGQRAAKTAREKLEDVTF